MPEKTRSSFAWAWHPAGRHGKAGRQGMGDKTTEISCLCGAVRVLLRGEPIVQFYCHCRDCQAVHGDW